MATAKLTILGIEQYKQSFNTSIFDSMVLPSGYDAEDVQNSILLECGEFEALYPDADFLTEAIGIWSKKWFKTFDKWYIALNTSYNPLENYDRIEEFNDTSESTGSTRLHTAGNTGSTTENKVAAYDSTTYEPSANATSNDTNTQDSDGTTNGVTNNTRTGRTHGNIGVTTSQQMLESELNVAKWNLLNHIADIFKSELCVAVYE